MKEFIVFGIMGIAFLFIVYYVLRKEKLYMRLMNLISLF